MSFKTYICQYTGSAIGNGDWFDSEGSMLFLTTDYTDGAVVEYYCNPETSFLYGSSDELGGGAMTVDDFNELWPLLVLMMFVGIGIKYLRKVFDL